MAKKEEKSGGGSKKGSWYATGKDGMTKSKQEDEAMKQRREQRKDMPWRFRLDSNEEHVKGTFLDSPKFFFREHNLKIGGKFGNYFTCLSDYESCPLDSGDNPSYVVAGTIIDHREYEDSKGETHKNQKRLFIAKGKARERIVRLLESKGSLEFCVVEFSRGSSPTECSTGEDIQFVRQLKKDQLKGFIPKGETLKWLEPWDYEKIFAPKPVEELRKMVGMAPPIGAGEESSEKETSGKGKGKVTEKESDSIDDLL